MNFGAIFTRKPSARLLLILAALTLFGPARADVVFDEVRGWQIVISDEYKGCVAVGKYRDGTVTRFGFDGISSTTFLNLSNDRWYDYPVKKYFELTFEFDRVGTFSGYFHTVHRDNVLTFENGEVTRNFMEAFASSSRVRVAVDGKALTSFELSGTRAAMAKLNECRRRTRT